ncbi:MAG: hypothetical protein M3046_05175 [Actinomycetota bacterium]|nr:hypothetical protein [Actinomycetota bacterium]
MRVANLSPAWRAQLDRTCAELAAASGSVDDGDGARLEAARRKLTDCDDRLARYRAALEGG